MCSWNLYGKITPRHWSNGTFSLSLRRMAHRRAEPERKCLPRDRGSSSRITQALEKNSTAWKQSKFQYLVQRKPEPTLKTGTGAS
ncbi:hypothetical protein M514_18986 [Trichuris suis]|uniref:Uncharacterized protein n=1 Tax=Trichuris suis TaxID=68888 RepID=A0A085NGZ9_9BILA|nr:hypothetical protein M514_18986 [Trichuris suis]